MKRNEVWWVAFDPSVGGEIRKTRPAIIISNDTANLTLNRLQVVPISSQISRVFTSEVLVMLNGQPRKALGDQVTTVSKLRLGSKMGELSDSDMVKVSRVVRFQLGLL